MINFFPLVWHKENIKYINIDVHVLEKHSTQKAFFNKIKPNFHSEITCSGHPHRIFLSPQTEFWTRSSASGLNRRQVRGLCPAADSWTSAVSGRILCWGLCQGRASWTRCAARSQGSEGSEEGCSLGCAARVVLTHLMRGLCWRCSSSAACWSWKSCHGAAPEASSSRSAASGQQWAG